LTEAPPVNARNRLLIGLTVVATGLGVSTAGCSSRSVLPDVSKRLAVENPPIPGGASPVYRWHGSRRGLLTYWGPQDVSVEAKAFIPERCADARDGRWEASGRNAEGKPIPFLGVLRRYRGESGAELAEIVPEVDLPALPDCLYLVIEPNVTLDGPSVKSIQPIALICEVRQHMFKPFRVKVPLVPEQELPLTPKPEIPEPPSGTPFPAN